MTKGKLDKIVNSGMKAKLILIGICAILLIVMILVLCLTGASEDAPVAGENSSFVSETSDAQPETTNAESSGSTDAAGSTQQTDDVESGPEGTVNQQEAGEAAQVSQAPVETQNQSGEETTEEPQPVGDGDHDDNASSDPTSTTQPDPSTTATPQAPQTDTTAGKPGTMIVVEQQDDMMVVTTGYCVVEYPFAFSEVIQVALRETETGAALEFIASIRGQTAPLYTLWLNTETGIPYGTVTVEGYTTSVNVETHDPTGLTEENKVTFNAAQETINDVLQSLPNRNTFVPAN